MANEPKELTRSHIGFGREPEIERPRRKQQGRAPTLPARDRRDHGKIIGGEVSSAVSDVGTVRQALGIAPDRLLVLEFTSLDAGSRNVLEDRFGAAVVDEQVEKRQGQDVVRMVVQFPTDESIRQVQAEADQYSKESNNRVGLPLGVRRTFFDGLEKIGQVSRSDRTGSRLKQEGLSGADSFPVDVDLWHPGTPEGAREVLDQLRNLCETHHGRVLDGVRTSSLLLARVLANDALAETLLDLDLVARVDLPPRLPPVYGRLFDDHPALPEHDGPAGGEPLVCVVDSGVLPGHPLLRGWVVDGVDFESGEDTPADRQGHGTQVAGLVVYGSIARCIEDGAWTPEVLVANAKVLRRHPFDESATVFPDDHRPEALVARAIRHFNDARGCRVFNLSMGNPADIYGGGRQFPWAEVLDELARELDVVIVVAAGNVAEPEIPADATTRKGLRAGVRDSKLSDRSARICNPGTAAVAVTVGAVARSDAPRTRDSFPGSPAGAPSPFSRVGPGYQVKGTQRAVKPEFVAHGGNFAVRSFGGEDASWVRGDLHLGEPTTRLDPAGDRPLTAVSGTSFAAPHVSHAAALALQASTTALGEAPANVVRALLGVSAVTPECGGEWLRDPKGREVWDKLRMVGYGLVDSARVRASVGNDACLVGADTIEEDHWHVFAIPVPGRFLSGRGLRSISVALAYDPPVRSSRKEYLGRTMWLEVLKGLTTAEVEAYRAPHSGPGKARRLPQSKLLDMRPAKTDLAWSTLQVRRKTWTRAPTLPTVGTEGTPVLHLVVGCHRRFPHGEDGTQRYGVAVRFRHADAQVDLYQELRASVRAHAPVAIRAEALVRRGAP